MPPMDPILAAYFADRTRPRNYFPTGVEAIEPGNPMQQPTDPAMPPVAPVPVSSVNPQILEYFKQVKPELFSQDAYDTARGEDEAQNRVNTAARGLQSATSLFTNRSPDYAGLEPTNAAVKALLAKQEMAQRSMAVGGQMSQLQAAQDAQDPRSGPSLLAYSIASRDPVLGPRLAQLGGPGAVSAAAIGKLQEMAKSGAELGKLGAETTNLGATTAKSAAETATEEQMRPGKVTGQGLTNAKTAAEIPGVKAGTAKAEAETREIEARTAQLRRGKKFDIDFTEPSIPPGDARVNKIQELAADGRASLEAIAELKQLVAGGVPKVGPELARVKQLTTSLQMKLKNIYGLGVLNKSDMDLLNNVVSAPGGIKAWLQDSTNFRDFSRMLDDLASDTRKGVVAQATGIGSTPRSGTVFADPSAPPKVSSPAEYDALPRGTVYMDPDGVQRTKG